MDIVDDLITCSKSDVLSDMIAVIIDRGLWDGVRYKNLESLLCQLLLQRFDVSRFVSLVENDEYLKKKVIRILSNEYAEMIDMMTEVSIALYKAASIYQIESRKSIFFGDSNIDMSFVGFLYEISISLDEFNLECYFGMFIYCQLIDDYEKLKTYYSMFIEKTIKLANSPSFALSQYNSKLQTSLLDHALDQLYSNAENIMNDEKNIHFNIPRRQISTIIKMLNKMIIEELNKLDEKYDNPFGYTELFSYSYWHIINYLHNHRIIKVNEYKKTLLVEYRAFCLSRYAYTCDHKDIQIIRKRVYRYEEYRSTIKSDEEIVPIEEFLMLNIRNSSISKKYDNEKEPLLLEGLNETLDQQLSLQEFQITSLQKIMTLTNSTESLEC